MAVAGLLGCMMARVMPAMRVGEFLTMVQERALALLPNGLQNGATSRVSSSWLWVHYHSPKVHYEVWLARKIGADRDRAALRRGARVLVPLGGACSRRYMPEIQARLGPQVELEEWTASWARVHQTVPYDPLSEMLADEVAQRLAETIAVLQPMVERERENVPEELERVREAVRAGSGGGSRIGEKGARRAIAA